MQSIILYGKNNNDIANVLIKALSEKFHLYYIDKDKLLSQGTGEIFLIIKTDTIKNIDCSNSIIIIDENMITSDISNICKDSILIMGNNHLNVPPFIIQNIDNIFTCGFGEKNYITFSSRTIDSATISIQRSIKIKNVIDIEPCEISCQITIDISDYNLLAASLALTLVFSQNLDLGKNITKIYL